MADELITSLHNNASSFFDKVYVKNKEFMQCANGCAECCKVDLSVFEIEAERIKNWFHSLDSTEKLAKVNLWKKPSKDDYCQFLYDNSCTVYPARPTICRTQGLPLFLEKDNIIDFCPLNFKSHAPEKADWLNLERLNTMLAMAANSVQKSNRIHLKDLKSDLMQNLT